MFKKLKLIAVVVCVLVALSGCDGLNAVNSYNYYGRSSFGKGACKTLTEDVYTIAIFLDDNESSWNSDDISRFWHEKIKEGIAYIEENAKSYGVDLSVDEGYYATDMSKGMVVRYDGVVEADLMAEEVSRDFIKKSAASLGFESEYDMHQHLQEYSGKEQIAYFIVLNKPGRSYSVPGYADSDAIEYCVLFNEYLSNNDETHCSTVAHEFLHLFGAEDYYDPYGKEPERAALAKVIYPDDIMYRISADINDLSIGAYTAYTVGWLNELPEECDREDWWQ